MAKSKNAGEFTKADWDSLNDAQRILHDLLAKMDKAETCGVVCDGYRQIHREISDRLQLIRQHYMPNQPQ